MTQQELFSFWDKEIKRDGRIVVVNGDRVNLTKWFNDRYDVEKHFMKSKDVRVGFRSVKVQEIQ